MRTAILTITLAGVFLPLAPLASQLVLDLRGDEEKVRITELELNRMDYGDVRRRGRTNLTVTVDRDEADIVAIQTDLCKISKFVDDKGSDLTDEAQLIGWGTTISRSALGLSSDGASAAVRFMIMALPSVGARRLNASGEIVLTVGTVKGTSRKKDVNLRKDTAIKAGESVLNILEVEKSEDEQETALTFTSTGLPMAVTDLEFFDSLGNRIRTLTSGIAVVALQPDGTGTSKLTCTLEGLHDKADMKISYWKSTKDVTIKFDLDVSLGLRGK